MGLPLTQISDYKSGEYSLPLNALSQKDLLSDLERYERKNLCDLLGFELLNLLIADLDSSNLPQEPRFVALYDYLQVKDNCRSIKYQSEGIKPMLKGFVCFEYIRSIEFQSTMVGTKSNNSANSENKKNFESKALNLYNLSIDYYQAIQVYICENLELYPEYDGEVKGHISVI